jgi:hypothetical protein
VSVGWEAAKALEVDPKGTSLVLLLPEMLVWLDTRPLAEIPYAKFPWPGLTTTKPANFFDGRAIVK